MSGLAALLLSQAVNGEVQLSVAGAIVMTISIMLVCGLNAFCIYRITRESQPSEHLHAPLEIDTHDDDNDA